MAKLVIELPSDWEARVVERGDNGRKQLEVTPTFVRGNVSSVCAYLTTEGDNGAQRKSMLMLNGNTGWPEVRKVIDNGNTCPFDGNNQPLDDDDVST